MDLVLTTQDIELLPEPRREIIINSSQGLLNSNYQKIVRENYNRLNTRSVFGVKQYVKSEQYQFTSGIETVLKLSVFATIFTVIFS